MTYKIKKKGKNMNEKNAFPSEVFVWWETEEGSNEKFLMISNDIAQAVNTGESRQVAKYELMEMQKVTGTVLIEEIKPVAPQMKK
jgi:hypothetical protein